MGPDCSCRHHCQLAFILLVFMLTLSLSTLLERMPLPQCVIGKSKNTTNQFDYSFNFDFPSSGNLSMLETFRIKMCDSNSGYLYCTKWEDKDIYSVCQKANISRGISCKIRDIDASRLVADRLLYQFSVTYNSTIKERFQVLLNSLTCECKNFSFDPNLNISLFPLSSKAEVSIKTFTEYFIKPDFDMTIIPNKSLIIEKDDNKLQYQLKKLDKCQKYSVKISLGLKAITFKQKCKNDWKMKPGIIEFQIPQLNIDDVNCSHNLTNINFTSTSTINSYYYYNLSIVHVSYRKTFTSNKSAFSVRAGNITSEDQVGFVSLCDLNCDRCGMKQSILCHYKRQNPSNPLKELNKKQNSVSMMLILIATSVGFVSIIMVTVACIKKHQRKTRRPDSSREPLILEHDYLDDNHSLNDLNENDLIEPTNFEPIYEEINNSHTYDKPDIELHNSPVLSGVDK